MEEMIVIDPEALWIGTGVVVLLAFVALFVAEYYMLRHSYTIRLVRVERMAQEASDRYVAINRRLALSPVRQLIDGRIGEDGVLSAAEWDDLEAAVLSEVPYFKEKLLTLCSLSADDYRLCLLIRVGLTNKGIAAVLALTPSAVSKRERKFAAKLLGADGANRDLERFVSRL